MRKEKIVEEGETEADMARPLDAYTRTLVEAPPVLIS